MIGFFFLFKKNLERKILDIKPEHRWVRILSNVKILHLIHEFLYEIQNNPYYTKFINCTKIISQSND